MTAALEHTAEVSGMVRMATIDWMTRAARYHSSFFLYKGLMNLAVLPYFPSKLTPRSSLLVYVLSLLFEKVLP